MAVNGVDIHRPDVTALLYDLAIVASGWNACSTFSAPRYIVRAAKEACVTCTETSHGVRGKASGLEQ